VIGKLLLVALSQPLTTLWDPMDSREQKRTSIQACNGGGNTKGGMAFRRKGSVPDLSSLESDNHIGRASKHGQVTSNGGRKRHLQPVVGASVGEGGSKHLANWHVRSNIRQDRDDEDEPVYARYAGHLVSAAAHGNAEKSLGNTGIIKRSDESKLSNKKHEKTVIDLGKGGLGLGDKLFLFGLDLVSVNVVGFLGRKRVASVQIKKEEKDVSDAMNKVSIH
jgi:hypothetical protein